MSNKITPQAPSIEALVSLSEALGLSILPEQLAATQSHMTTLAEHAANVMDFQLEIEIEPAPKYQP